MDVIHDLEELLYYQVQKLMDAEEQQLKAMPSIISVAKHQSLKNVLQHHLDLTNVHKKRLQKISQLLAADLEEERGFSREEVSCIGIKGLMEDTEVLLKSELKPNVIDAAIIACVQEMEHYEICTYGTAVAYAKQMGLNKIEALLHETLNEEYDADDLLTALATSSYNKKAGPVAEEPAEEETAAPVGHSSSYTINERTINSPGGRAGTSHRRYPNGESRGH